jgi:hypothetical protein
MLQWVRQDTPAPQAHSDGAAPVDHGQGQAIEFPHIHGMGYSSDGSQLLVAAHDGLRIFAGDEWLVPDIPAHDYMGFSPTAEGFYSSGHPAPGSELRNPLGLVKSTDGGTTLAHLGFAGESDFHLMAVGYANQAIYVLNAAPNSRLAPGLHYSQDEGRTWSESRLNGLSAQPIQIAVHPTEPATVAIATPGGLFLSTDFGNTFNQIGAPEVVTAVAFSPDGQRLLFGSRTLRSYSLQSGDSEPLEGPELAADDRVAYLAVNPQRATEIAVATFERDIFLSRDGGDLWHQIVRHGEG